MDVAVRIAQQPEADALLPRSALALLVGALLDRQVGCRCRRARGHDPAGLTRPAQRVGDPAVVSCFW
ncbi:hypothetical protein [Streptomyces kaniharaensis]|uniref:hypothetical protein n=1 Tax=Streptomyces kaniharaensis TaxID=212423 RepID=UPI00389A0073